jgi:hypothetical protein
VLSTLLLEGVVDLALQIRHRLLRLDAHKKRDACGAGSSLCMQATSLCTTHLSLVLRALQQEQRFKVYGLGFRFV